MRGPYPIELVEREKARQILAAIGPDKAGLAIMLEKSRIYPLYVMNVRTPAANILKQQMLSLGGEAVVGRGVVNNTQGETDVLLLGTVKHYTSLYPKLAAQPWGLRQLGERLKELLGSMTKKETVCWEWPGRKLILGQKVLVMGILNVTPDSFSDGGIYLNPAKALERARQMVEDGADLIDVGGQSTRPGFQPISAEEEAQRVMPVLELLLKEVEVPISLDTYKAEVARDALSLGVHIINDVGGGLKDPALARVAAEHETPVIVMHNREMRFDSDIELVGGVIDGLAESLRIYCEAGLPLEKIAVDPGIGFGKGHRGDLVLLNNINSLQVLGRPVLLGCSRKSFLGTTLGLPVNQRLESSLAAAAWGVCKGADVLRVHDVKETVRLVRMLEAIKSAGGCNEGI